VFSEAIKAVDMNEQNTSPNPGRKTHSSKIERVERLKSSETLKEPWELLISILDAIDEKVYVSDPETNEILYVNPAKKAIFGEDIIGQKCHKIFQGLDAPCDFCTNPMIFGENIGKTHIWEFQNRKTGRWLRCIDRAIPWSDGGMMRFEMAIDIHERKVAEAEQQKSEKRFLDLAGTINEGFSAVDEIGTITYANEAFVTLLGYEPHEIIGLPLLNLVDEGDRSMWEMEFRSRRKRKSRPYELILVRKDGERVTTLINPRPLFDKNGIFRGSYAAITDLREIKQTEKTLRDREKELKVRATHLQEMNAALKVLLRRMEEDSKELEDKVRLNVVHLIHPHLEKLKAAGLTDRQKKHLEALEANLQEILSPFTHKLLADHPKLTPSELQIASLLRQGKSSKDIADELSLSFRTVETHRRNIRSKLGIRNKKANLKSYLIDNVYT
jgi:PAS domain S-box-containing protein